MRRGEGRRRGEEKRRRKERAGEAERRGRERKGWVGRKRRKEGRWKRRERGEIRKMVASKPVLCMLKIKLILMHYSRVAVLDCMH